MKKNVPVKAFVMLVFLWYMTGLCPAQAGRGKGRLAGTVVDESGKPVGGAKVRIEFEQGGLKDETKTNKKGEWGFFGLGSGRANLFVSAEGFLEAVTQVSVAQLNFNPSQRIVLKEDKERKARIKDEASLDILEKGNQLFASQKYDEALELFQKFTAENPAVFQIYFNIGDCFREKREYDKAIEQYNIGMNKAKEKNDIDLQAKAQASIGEVFLRQGDMKKAMEYFKNSVDLSPKDEILAYNVAEIFFSNGKTDEAIQYYQLSSQIKPNWPVPYLKIGYALLNKGEIAKAIESFQEYLKKDPNASDAAVVQTLIETLKKQK